MVPFPFFLLSLAPLVLAQDRTTEAGEASITDANAECTPYTYAPVNDVKALYPTLWTTADLSKASAYDIELFTALNTSIPNIAPRGTRAGNFSGIVYNGVADSACWWSYTKCDTPKLAGLSADITQCNEPNSWGFTLDDGPNCSHNAYYDYLQTINQKATLFYIGSNVMDWPLEGQRGLADGHSICAQTWSHPYMAAMTNEQAFSELYYSKKIIEDVLGVTARCWRPPYGDVDDRIRYIAAALDLVTVVWEDDTFDWQHATIGLTAVEANYQAILTKQANGTYATRGTIVLTHELDATTMNISQMYLPQIQKAFTGGVLPVEVCMNNTKPYANNVSDYVYPNYTQYLAGTRSISLLAPTAATTDIQLQFSSIKPTSSSGTSSGAVTTGTGSSKTSATSATATGSLKASGGDRASHQVAVALAVAGVLGFLGGVVIL